MKHLRSIVVVVAFTLSFVVVQPTITHASATLGTIDPRNVGNWKALMENTSLSAAPTVNFGLFTTQSAFNITVSNTELRGYAWGEGIGWIVTNCADTTSGCSSTNSNFKIANDGSGNLSGYAWGQNTGWINFGPFTNPAVSTVKITNGLFGGTLGNAGYAWTQNYGWMRFDCSSPSSCVETDWGVTAPPGGGGGGGSSGGSTQCVDKKDNDGDGLIDAADPGCHTDSNPNNTETYVPSDNDETDVIPPTYVCSDGIDNDLDGLKDYQQDPGCQGDPQGSSEINLSFCDLNPDDRACTGSTNPTCSDSFQNQGETSVDHGGPCPNLNPNPDPTTYACSDSQDNDNDGLIDRADPGCHTDNNPNNPASYVRTDPDEFNQVQPSCPPDSTDPRCTTPPTFCEKYPALCFTNPGPGPDTLPPTPFIPIPTTPLIKLITALGLLLPLASAAVSFLTANPIVLKDVPLLFGQGWSSFLIAIGWKERRKPWGVVYDSITKRPIDPAYVVLYDMLGNEVATAITDINGRYGFAVDPGTYRIVANKSNYQFPSTKLVGKETDGLYDDLYFGGEVVVNKEGEIITKNIPLDALAFDWNEYAKAKMGIGGSFKLAFYRKSDIFLYHVSRFMFVLGFAFSIYAMVFSPNIWNAIVLGLYVVMTIMRLFTPTFKKKGSVLSRTTKHPLPFSIVRLVSTATGTEVAHKVADRIGNYYGLVQNGHYQIVVDTRKDSEEGYDKHQLPDAVKVNEGYLKKNFKV